MDTARHARFERPGHAVTGVRDRTGAERRAGSGYDFAHAVIDDHSRLAYVELLDDERAATVTAFTTRALDWFAIRGIHARRLMTDNAWIYVKNQSLRELLGAREIKHLRTQAYRPQTNGKIERFHQTMAREWAYGLSYRSHRHRNRALPHWLEDYNTRRPHSGIGNRPPISRVHNLRGQDS
jgi:transposase InsO family protein